MAMRLLDDAQVKQFITTGCLELRVSELGPAFHQQLYERCCEHDIAAGDLANPGMAAQTRREVFVDIPELSRELATAQLPCIWSYLCRGTTDKATPFVR